MTCLQVLTVYRRVMFTNITKLFVKKLWNVNNIKLFSLNFVYFLHVVTVVQSENNSLSKWGTSQYSQAPCWPLYSTVKGTVKEKWKGV